MGDYKVPELSEFTEIPALQDDSMSHSRPYVAGPEYQEPLGFPGELVEDYTTGRSAVSANS